MKVIRPSAEKIGAIRRVAGAVRMQPQVLLEATCSGTSTKGNNVAVSGALSKVLSYCRRSEVAYPHQVVGGQGEREIPVHPGQSAVSHLPRHPHRLQPAEDLLDPFPQPLAHLVGDMPGRATIEGAVADLPGHVRRDIMLAQLLHEGRHVIALVSTQGDPSSARDLFPQLDRGLPFRPSRRLGQSSTYGQAVE